jgi:Arc/MetJ-type ribon-helix-helix transcriptional regulator
MPKRVPVTVSLPDAHAAYLRRIAGDEHRGNASEAVRVMLEDRATKSGHTLTKEATKAPAR